jgi:lycopene cyclase domain-containing protein
VTLDGESTPPYTVIPCTHTTGGSGDARVTPRLTYLAFLALFLLPPLAVLATGLRGRRRREDVDWRPRWIGLGLLVAVAVGYTTPWDNYLIAQGVWWYGSGTVLTTVWLAPLEEYLFMALQPVVVGLWLYRRLPPARDDVAVTIRERALGALAGGLVAVVGAALLSGSTYYLGAILAWAGPVLAVQWAFGWPYLRARGRTLVAGVAPPTLYLWAADWVAIRSGVWTISARHTTGVTLLGLPVEEAVFFLVTNLFVVQGLLLFLWVVEGRSRSAAGERSVTAGRGGSRAPRSPRPSGEGAAPAPAGDAPRADADVDGDGRTRRR